jgi:hypothetical protein
LETIQSVTQKLRVAEIVIDTLAESELELKAENGALRARVADLEENQAWLVVLVKVALGQLHEYYLDGVWARKHRRGIDPYGFLADEREWAA